MSGGSAPELLEKAKSGDSEALESFVEQNLGLVKMVISRFLGRGTEYEDLFQIGSIGLVKAIHNFRLDAGVMFSTYAVPVIIGELKRYFRDNGPVKVSRSLKETAYKAARARERLCARLSREPTLTELAAECAVEPEELVMALDASMPVMSLNQPVEGTEELLFEGLLGEDNTDGLIDGIDVRRAIEGLKDKERQLVLLRYFRNKTQQETARELAISQVQVSRLEKAIIEKLRRVVEV